MSSPAPVWPALELIFPPDEPGPVSNQDLALAALDGLELVAIEELTPSEWRVCFRRAVDRDAARHALSEAAGLSVGLHEVDVEDEDWARRSQADIRSVRVGRFVIAPPWDVPVGQADGDVVLVIEPSMGFGTGHHASTRLCLAALQHIEITNRQVLDVGTGSGILAMAAARLGASTVTALDIDPDAISSARDNLVLNGLSASIELRELDFRNERLPLADVVVANLTGGMLSMSAPQLLATCRAGGSLIVSGVLRTEEAEVVAAFGDRTSIGWRGTEDEWVGLVLMKARD